MQPTRHRRTRGSQNLLTRLILRLAISKHWWDNPAGRLWISWPREKGWTTSSCTTGKSSHSEEYHRPTLTSNSLGHAADAARRLKKLSLETKLVDRMLAVCRTYVISEEQLKNVSSRREHLRLTAIQVAVEAAKQLAQKETVV
jgi:hypothetical protein